MTWEDVAALRAVNRLGWALEKLDRAENCHRLSETDTSLIARTMKRTQKPEETPQQVDLIAARIDRQAKNTPGWIIKKRRKLHAELAKGSCSNG